MADAHAKPHHDYHLVDPSPWPLISSMASVAMFVGAVMWMKGLFGLPAGTKYVFFAGLAGVLYAMFQITIVLGSYPQAWLESGFSLLSEMVGSALPEGLLSSLIIDGLIAGVGGVLSFVPLVLIMFALIAIVEDSGYMARMAYIADRVFQMFGLHGASVMPYIISGGIAGGCAIPGVMATRTARSPRRTGPMITDPMPMRAWSPITTSPAPLLTTA